MESFAKTLGAALRQARRDRNLTLEQLDVATQGRFKRSALGAYERGERAISLEKFCELALLYGVAPDRLLGRALDVLSPVGRDSVVIDLDRVDLLTEPDGAIAEFVHAIQTRRQDHPTRELTLRKGDVDVLAQQVGVRPHSLLTRLEPILRHEMTMAR